MEYIDADISAVLVVFSLHCITSFIKHTELSGRDAAQTWPPSSALGYIYQTCMLTTVLCVKQHEHGFKVSLSFLFKLDFYLELHFY